MHNANFDLCVWIRIQNDVFLYPRSFEHFIHIHEHIPMLSDLTCQFYDAYKTISFSHFTNLSNKTILQCLLSHQIK